MINSETICIKTTVLLLSGIFAFSCQNHNDNMTKIPIPKANKISKELSIHNDVRIDNYYWLNEREDENVLSYLREEDAYADTLMAHTKDFQQSLFKEMKARIKEDDSSVPYKSNGYWYFTRFETGKEYPIFSRKKGTEDAPEEILFNCNSLAQGHDYFNLGGLAISPDNSLAAFGVDTVSRRQYHVQIKNLTTGEIFPDKIENTTGGAVWGNDNKTLYYTKKDPITLRSDKIYKHKLGTPASEDELVFHEKDETFGTYVYKSKSKKYIIIGSFSTLTSEFQILPADDPVDIFKNYYILSERENGLNKLKIVRWDNTESYYLPFDNETYTAYVGRNPEFDTEVVRYGYNSMTTPTSVIDFNMETRQKEIKKEQVVLGGKFDKENYISERIWATARDGVKVPMSIIYHKDTKLDGTSPLLQYAYGSYGATIDPYFSSIRLSLLDRGFIYAIAHVRGGQYLGRTWYEDGKLLKKKNTFADFVDCSKYLIDQKYTSPAHLYASGGSAGGLLMGAIVNMAPELYNGVIASVPFVDVVTTMLDDDIPLTTGEFDEWGNPKDKEYYDYMKSYSPYDNVSAQAYPNMYISTGLHDSQVQYFEPAKWVAKLRALKTDNNILVFDINMEAGHGGASGRFESLKEVSKEYAFLLDLEHKIP